MSWKPIAIDESITRFGGEGLIHVLEGNYLLQLTKLEPSPEDRDYAGEKGEPQLAYMQAHFQIEDGPDGAGKTLRYTGTLAQAKEDGSGGAWALGRMLAALGADPAKLVGAQFPTYQHFVAYTKQIEKLLLTAQGGPKGKTGAEVSDNQNVNPRTGKVQVISNITGFFPAAEWALRKQSNAAPHPSNGAGVGTPYPTPAPATGSANGSTVSTASAASTSVAEPVQDMEALVASIMSAATA